MKASITCLAILGALLVSAIGSAEDYLVFTNAKFSDGTGYYIKVKKDEVQLPAWDPVTDPIPVEPKKVIQNAITEMQQLLGDDRIQFRSLSLNTRDNGDIALYIISLTDSKKHTFEIPVLLNGQVLLPTLTDAE